LGLFLLGLKIVQEIIDDMVKSGIHAQGYREFGLDGAKQILYYL